ncbi:MAG TPA: NfeD family protein [Phycisphaerae bacterium]|nr:NfeD family protein [Phycisphaerae bacterium]
MKQRLQLRFVALVIITAAAVSTVAAEGPAPATQPATTMPTTGPASKKIWLGMIPKGTFERTPQAPPPALPKAINRAFVIPIHGGINDVMADVLQKKIAICKGRGAQIVIFDINSPGGELKAMERIINLIRDDLRGIYTVAYVNPEAISAAGILSLACNEIVLTPVAKIGDAMPVLVGPQGYIPIPKEERGKIESYARADVRVQAQLSGYNVALCEAMVTLDREIWLIKERRTGELKVVDSRDYPNSVLGAPAKDNNPPPDAQWQFMAIIDGPNELVTMTADEAAALGFAEQVLPSMKELREHYNIVGEPAVLADSLSDRVVGVLTSPLVTAVLVMAGLFCLYTELRTPGFGIFGIFGIACFAILFGSRYLIGLANWVEIALFALGVLLIAIEIFAIPGFGVVGILGIICCVVALAAMAVANPPDVLPIPQTRLDWSIFESGLFALAVGFFLAIVAAAAAAKYLPKASLARGLVLVPASSGASAVSETSPIARIKAGDLGQVENICRPVGKVRFGDDLLDATSEGGIIEAGAEVRVLRREGNNLIIERVKSA